MDNFCKVCRLGVVQPEYATRGFSVFVKIEYKDGRLSISGVEGPLQNGDALGSCGQIDMHLKPDNFKKFAQGWDKNKVNSLLKIWERWHLNDMVPGTPKQMEIIRQKQAEADLEDSLHKQAPHAYAYKKGFSSYYEMELAWLAEQNLVVDEDYRFGSKWLTEQVPQEILEQLKALPDADKKPAWV